MMAAKINERVKTNFSQAARARFLEIEGRPLFLGDWSRTVFIHYEVDAELLQQRVPYELDLFEGRAFVSLVAFTQRRLRPSIGGRATSWMLAPIATHEFLNLRTYIRCNDERGIFFIAEWLSNRFSVSLGPPVYGLPYRFGRIVYRHDHENGLLSGEVASKDATRFVYRAEIDPSACFDFCQPGSLNEFLMERYTAFTQKEAKGRLFHVWHERWPQVPIKVAIERDDLLPATEPWFEHAELTGANYSPGVRDVWIGHPRLVDGQVSLVDEQVSEERHRSQ